MTSRTTIPVCSAVAKIMHAGAVKYTFGFETAGVDSWVGFFGAVDSNIIPPHRGSYSGATNLPIGTATRTRSVTALTIGRRYVLSAWARGGGVTFAVGISGIGSSAAYTPRSGVWTKLFYSFIATATSHTMQLITVATSGIDAWDDIQLIEAPYEVDSIDLDLEAGSRITLDEGRIPYAEATLNIALPPQADLDLLDTRTINQVRVQVTLAQTFVSPALPFQSRTFDLLLHERGADHAAAGSSVSLICRSDEALLIDAGNETSTTDATALVDQISLRGIIATMLENSAAYLEPGTADADFSLTIAVDNIFSNPSFETNTDYTALGTGASARASTTAQARSGTHSCRWTAAAGGSDLALTPDSAGANFYGVTPGELIAFSFYLVSTVARNANSLLRFYTGNGTGTQTDFTGSVSATTTGSWTRYTITATVPAGATTMRPFIQTTGNASGNQHYVDDVMLTKGSLTLWPAFSGATTPDTYYTYSWEGTAHASVSHRLRLDARDPKLLYQDPGEHDWDVLHQLVQVAGLRLFCDEQRRWYLVNPATYVPAGTVALIDAVRGRDRISRESGDWADAVVVKYTWIGTDGLQKVSYDSATAGGTCLVEVDWNRPYPGPGAAAAILDGYSGRGRVQEIVAPAELLTAPGMALETTLPNTPDQEGFVARVSWSIGEHSALGMTVNARDLVDA